MRSSIQSVMGWGAVEGRGSGEPVVGETGTPLPATGVQPHPGSGSAQSPRDPGQAEGKARAAAGGLGWASLPGLGLFSQEEKSSLGFGGWLLTCGASELLSAEESGVQPVTSLPPAQRTLTGGRVYVSVCEWPGSQHPGRYRPVSCCAPCPLQPRGTGHTLSPTVRAAGLPSRPRFLRTVWPLTAITQILWVAGLQGGVHAGGRAGGAPWISPTLQACLPTGDCYTGGPAAGGSPLATGLGPPGPWTQGPLAEPWEGAGYPSRWV